MLDFHRASKQSVLGSRQRLTSISTLFGFWVCNLLRARAENQTGYRYETYQEDGTRINVETHSVLFDVQPRKWLTVNGEFVYDAISGFSPTGSPPPNTITFVQVPPPPGASSTFVPLSHMDDIRRAGSVGATVGYKRHRFSPGFSYGEEHDYRARGASFNYSADFNDKNTTLNLGASYDWDVVLPNGFLKGNSRNKNAMSFMVGLNQLLGPRTVFTANFTYGYSRGYLDDQYKGVLFDNEAQGSPESPALEPEKRPGHRSRYIGYVSVTQDLTPYHASVEASYRLSYDSYEITAHTLQVAVYQKLGRHITFSPMFRYYRQNEAGFYGTRFPDFNTPPANYSADYRLSELESYSVGVSLNWKVREWLSLDAAYKRYVMRGLDSMTSPTAYPSANVLTVGARVWF